MVVHITDAFAAMDVAEWLRGLGLEQYEPAFRDNDIDAEVLPKLTAEDLTGSRRHLGRASAQAARRYRRASACRGPRRRGGTGARRWCTGGKSTPSAGS